MNLIRANEFNISLLTDIIELKKQANDLRNLLSHQEHNASLTKELANIQKDIANTTKEITREKE